MDGTNVSTTARNGRRIGMAVTAFKIGPVLSDTIHSLLDQRNVDIAALVLVIDGCSFTTSTQEICNRYARAYPGLFHTIWLDNGGVARARNHAVRWLIERFPDIEGVFLLDGDDLLTPNSAATSLELLQDARKAPGGPTPGWVYCDQVQFGHQRMALKYPRGFRSSRWLGSNLSQPSCLISREMFDAGVYWDEGMRQGNEDWEYWHTAIGQGFAGVHNPVAYLKYRRLTGNRSSLNRAKDALSKGQMRSKHGALLRPSRFCADEQQTFPRWALPLADGRWRLTTDPTLAGATVDHAAFVDAVNYRFAHNRGAAYLSDPYFPDLIASLDPADLELLQQTGLLCDLLYEAELALLDRAICMLEIRREDASRATSADAITVEAKTGEISLRHCAGASFLLSIGRFADWFGQDLRDLAAAARASGAEGAVETLDGATAPDAPPQAFGTRLEAELTAPREIRRLVVTLPAAVPERPGASPRGASCYRRIFDLAASTLDALARPTAPSKLNQPRHQHCGQDKDSHAGLGAELFGLWPIRPQVKVEGRTDIALILPGSPTAAFRRCCAELSALAGTRDIALHVVSLGREVPADFGGIEPLVRSRIALNLAPGAWTPKTPQTYFGVPLYERVGRQHQDSIAGRLCGMEAVINFAGPVVSGPMIWLKKFGVVTALSYDSAAEPCDFDAWYREDGSEAIIADPMAASAFLGAYKCVLVPDETSRLRLESVGVPAAAICSETTLGQVLIPSTAPEPSPEDRSDATVPLGRAV